MPHEQRDIVLGDLKAGKFPLTRQRLEELAKVALGDVANEKRVDNLIKILDVFVDDRGEVDYVSLVNWVYEPEGSLLLEKVSELGAGCVAVDGPVGNPSCENAGGPDGTARVAPVTETGQVRFALAKAMSSPEESAAKHALTECARQITAMGLAAEQAACEQAEQRFHEFECTERAALELAAKKHEDEVAAMTEEARQQLLVAEQRLSDFEHAETSVVRRELEECERRSEALQEASVQAGAFRDGVKRSSSFDLVDKNKDGVITRDEWEQRPGGNPFIPSDRLDKKADEATKAAAVEAQQQQQERVRAEEAAKAKADAERLKAESEAKAEQERVNTAEAAAAKAKEIAEERPPNQPLAARSELALEVGIPVYLHNLEKAKQFNGATGVLRDLDTKRNAWNVVMDESGEIRAVRFDNLRPAPQAGATVVLQGMSQNDLNGQQAKVVKSSHPRPDAWNVRLESGKVMAVKTEHMAVYSYRKPSKQSLKLSPAAVATGPQFGDDELPDVMPSLASNLSLAADVFRDDPTIYAKLKDKKSKFDVPFANCVKPTFDNRGCPETKTVGAVCADASCYDVFREFFDEVIRRRHGGFDPATTEAQPKDLDASKVADGRIDDAGCRVISATVVVSRNFDRLRFAPSCSEEERREVESVAVKAFTTLPENLQGQYVKLLGSASPASGTPSKEQEQELAREGFLFKAPTSELLLSSGFGRQWPDARGVFVTKSRNLHVRVNEGDHLRLVSSQKGDALKEAFQELCRFLQAIEASCQAETSFAHDQRLGFLGCCPSNLGTTLSVRVILRIPLLGGKDDFVAICTSLKLQVRGKGLFDDSDLPSADSSQGLWEIANLHCLGSSEVDQVNTVIQGCRVLLECENRLSNGNELPGDVSSLLPNAQFLERASSTITDIDGMPLEVGMVVELIRLKEKTGLNGLKGVLEHYDSTPDRSAWIVRVPPPSNEPGRADPLKPLGTEIDTEHLKAVKSKNLRRHGTPAVLAPRPVQAGPPNPVQAGANQIETHPPSTTIQSQESPSPEAVGRTVNSTPSVLATLNGVTSKSGLKLQPGDRIHLCGLKSQTDKNGQSGTLVRFVNGYCIVDLGAGVLRSIKPENVELATELAAFKPGDKVKIVNLRDYHTLNDLEGELRDWNPDKAYWTVDLAGRRHAVKCENILRVETGGAVSAKMEQQGDAILTNSTENGHAPKPESKWRVGDVAFLRGLEKEPHLNNTRVILKKHMTERDCWAVSLSDGSVRGVREDNLVEKLESKGADANPETQVASAPPQPSPPLPSHPHPSRVTPQPPGTVPDDTVAPPEQPPPPLPAIVQSAAQDPQVPPVAPKEPDGSATFKPGAQVEIHGLKVDEKMNGKAATVMKLDDTKGIPDLYQVIVRGEGSFAAVSRAHIIRKANLREL